MDHNLLEWIPRAKMPLLFLNYRFLKLWDLENLINVGIYISKQSNLIVTFLLF